MDSTHSALGNLEAYVHKNQLNELLRPGGVRKPVLGKSLASVMLLGVVPMSSGDKIQVHVKRDGRDDTSPEDERHRSIALEVALAMQA